MASRAFVIFSIGKYSQRNFQYGTKLLKLLKMRTSWLLYLLVFSEHFLYLVEIQVGQGF